MAWEMKTDRPIYIQIVEKLKNRIVSGYYPPGEKIPSVRELASEAGVNPNTMQKALGDLERQGLLHTQRTNGKTVTDEEDKILAMREGMAEEETGIYFEKMRSLGYVPSKTREFVDRMAARLEA
ncbi:MAG: GntR family transcriptional regulator [Lachnospiraceae bacterium]|nr:GntR family transcriptional regulator [Lachnospiraceae bacterium]